MSDNILNQRIHTKNFIKMYNEFYFKQTSQFYKGGFFVDLPFTIYGPKSDAIDDAESIGNIYKP